MIIASPMVEYRDGITMDFTDELGIVDDGVRINFKVYNSEPWNGGDLVASFTNIRACSDTTLNLKNAPFRQYATITVTEMGVSCANANGTSTILYPTAALYSKELDTIRNTESRLWSYVGILRDGSGTTLNKLQGGKQYKFGITPNSMYTFTTDELQIRQFGNIQRGITIPNDLNSTISLKFTKTAWDMHDVDVTIIAEFQKKYRFEKIWAAPARVCEGYKRRL
jgi:hypothetical protein